MASPLIVLMYMNPVGKYKPFPNVVLENRQWPNREITHAPLWCSVDLRDGNQALSVPMGVPEKMRMFDCLVKCGFKQIEVGFPSASATEFSFVRQLIVENRIPDDVTIQVLVPAREELIAKTMQSLIGVRRVIIHLYNSTSPAQRTIVFGLSKSQIIDLAVQGAQWIQEYAKTLEGTEVLFQYSPESFSATEIDFSLEVCEAVIGIWKPTPQNKVIINLPSTVEVATPNVYADQIEWFCRHMMCRESVLISLHTHNDRGTGVAATELGLLAGADRVEGTLFGNGERTGNLDIVTVALNMYTQGIDPRLNFSDLESTRLIYEECTGMTVHPRQPYSGELVFTAFSGSHQDAIRKGLQAAQATWNVPYLTIDPKDVGRSLNGVIRVNGQSGKGGVAYILEHHFGIHIPKNMLREFGAISGKRIDALQREATPDDIKRLLWEEYVTRNGLYTLTAFHSVDDMDTCHLEAEIKAGDSLFKLSEIGNGPIDAFVNALRKQNIIDVQVLDQSEHALSSGASAQAIGYVQLQFPNRDICWGVGVDTSIPLASIHAVISAINRAQS